MSSAAVQQNTPQQYQQTASARDRYPVDASANLSSSPPSSRRPGRQSSGNGTPQHASYTSPGSSSTITPSRGQQMGLSSHPSPADPPMNSSTYEQFYPDSAGSRAPPTSLPIRTSSQQQPQASTAPAFDNRPYSSREQSGGYGSESDRDRASERDRRRGQRSPHDSPAQPSSGRSQRTRPAPIQSRSTNAVGQVDSSLPRENSAIINHIVVDDPQSDIARERARIAEARPNAEGTDVTPVTGLGLVGDQGIPDSQRSSTTQRSRQEHLKSAPHRKEVKFGDYILGQTLGEGEFGKVKMGWKKEGGVQVAIKLIRKESLAGNTTRLPKIYREISILRELQHPNIVRLHEFVETERHMGIILEYASGGELFDYILNHRYLKDPAARRLFAQLVSGVGYLHKKGIVHRDLKLENLLLDRYKNIIITDFGFANTFSPQDELGVEVERRISDKDFVKRQGLDAIGKDGHRRGDLMQTSCGSPCYAAPELVVSDGLYTGRKVDVWSCGVILYAMLAGYLPFDDDPANPEGDNINLLYKYIVSTPLTFPEYVTPHARDLLRRILVPDPRQRADLFEVARHSWLSEYSHVVGFIGSSTKTEGDIASSAAEQNAEPLLGRSASVREPTSKSPANVTAGDRSTLPEIGGDETSDVRNKQRDKKRQTVQLEYVAPQMSTQRGDTSPVAQQPVAPIAGSGKTRARADSQGPVEVPPSAGRTQQIPRKEVAAQAMPPPSRPTRDEKRATSDSSAFGGPPVVTSRPNTRGTLASRGNSYSQPAMATPTNENVQGHFSQPKSGSGYIISGPMSPAQSGQIGTESSRPTSQQDLSRFQQQPQQQQQQQQQFPQRGHKRSTTLGSITDRVLGRSNSRRQSQQGQDVPANEKKDRKYPPVSMKNAIPNNPDDMESRKSSESRRSSLNLFRKNSDAPSEKRSSRRFSFLPASLSFSGKNNQPYDSVQGDGGLQQQESMQRNGRPASKGMAFGRGQSRSPSQSTTNSTIPLYYEPEREAQRNQRRSGVPQHMQGTGEKPLPQRPNQGQYPTPPPVQRKQFRDDGYGNNALEPNQNRQEPARQDPPERFYTPTQDLDQLANEQQPRPDQYNPGGGKSRYQREGDRNDGYNETAALEPTMSNSQNIRPSQRKFDDAYNQGHGGSSSGARRVMDFFRRKGKDRTQQ